MRSVVFTIRQSGTGSLLWAAAVWLAAALPLRANPDIYQHTLRSTGWVIVPREGNASSGTCWLVNRALRLAVTCQHVVGDARELVVYFPHFDADGAVAESAFYLHDRPPIVGRVVRRDTDADLALLQLAAVPPGVEALGLAAHSSRPGELVHSVGNSGLGERLDHGTLWWYTRGSVRQVSRRVDKKTGRVIRLVETQSPVNRGDSGGPVVNDRGELVGVTDSYDASERLVSQNIDVGEVKRLLEGYRTAEKDHATEAVAMSMASPPNVRGAWKFTAGHSSGATISGEGTFHADGTFVLAGPRQSLKGRYSYVNGVLWMIFDDYSATAGIAWQGRDRFVFHAGKAKMLFVRSQ